MAWPPNAQETTTELVLRHAQAAGVMAGEGDGRQRAYDDQGRAITTAEQARRSRALLQELAMQHPGGSAARQLQALQDALQARRARRLLLSSPPRKCCRPVRLRSRSRRPRRRAVRRHPRRSTRSSPSSDDDGGGEGDGGARPAHPRLSCQSRAQRPEYSGSPG